jgi:hypothetical protein
VYIVKTSQHSYLDHDLWNSAWQELQAGHQEARNSIDTWVIDVYGAVQAGDLDVNELLSGAAIATKAAEDSGLSRAHADLISLGADVALERAVTISTTSDSIDWTMTGMLAATASPSGGFVVGNTYTPNSASNDGSTGTVWMVVNSADIVGSWSNYNAPVDGGIVSFTQKPPDATTYQINTLAGETATVAWNEFSENTTDGAWETDISSKVEQSVTEIDSVDVYYSNAFETTRVIENDFTVEKITNQDTGENFDSVTPSQLVTDNPENFQTADDFKANNQMWNDVYDKIDRLFKEVEGTSGGGGGPWLDGIFPSLPGLNTIQSLGVVAAGIAILNFILGN